MDEGDNRESRKKNGDRFDNLFIGVVAIIIGIVFLGDINNWFGIGIRLGLDKIWPVFIILGGIYLIMQNRR